MIETPKRYELPFPLSEYRQRLSRVREAMKLAAVDVAIVEDPQDLYWLTGTRITQEQTPNDNHLIIWEGAPTMVVRHIESQVHQSSTWIEHWVTYVDEGPINPYDPIKKVVEALSERGMAKKKIGVNFRLTTIQDHNRLCELLPDAKIQDFRVEQIRVIKSKLEQECQFKASKVNQDALVNTINEMEIGWSQQDIESCITRYQMKYLGDEYEKTLVLCLVGRDLLLMHQLIWGAEAREARIKKGDIVFLESGAFVKRYVGAMTRMVAFGEPPAQVRRSCEASIESLDRAIEATAPGKTSHDIDKASRDYFRRMGLDCPCRLGYSVGIDWVESGVMSIEPKNPLKLAPGHVLNYMPINFLQGWGYMGASEQVLVTKNGHEVLADRDRTCERKLFVK
jgi:Xaa-Pro aminopeptidase